MKYLKEYLLATGKMKEIINPSEFLELHNNKRRKQTLSVEIDPPKLGENNFGSIIIRYKIPIKNYEILNQKGKIYA